jgi:tetratricopeptide (TPR) repeat protein
VIGSIAWPSTRTIAIAVVSVVVLLMAGFGAWLWYDAQQRRVQEAYADVSTRVQLAQAPDAPAETKVAAVRDLEQWLSRHPSARAVPQAAYELGNLRFGLKLYAGARIAYELSLQRGASGTLRPLVQASLARTWEAERDFARAADAYGALVKDLNARSFLYEDALLDQARMFELAGRKADAIAAYQKLLKDVPTARRAEDVRIRLAALGTASR